MLTLLPISQDARDAHSLPVTGTGPNVGPGTHGNTSSLAPSWGEASWSDTWAGEDVLSGKTRSSKERFQGLSARAGMHTWKSKTVTPGPGTYPVRLEPDSAPIDRQSGPERISVSAFRSRGPRIGPWQCPGASAFMKSSVLENPGPGSYALARAMDVKEEKASPDAHKSAPILGVSESSPAIPQARDPAKLRYTGREKDSLAPCDYDPEVAGTKHTAPSSNFHTSKSERNLPLNPEMVKNPAPCSYNVRSRLTKGVSSSFKSNVAQTVTLANTNQVPGPGQYLAEGEHREVSPSGKEKPIREFPGLKSSTDRMAAFRMLEQPFTDPDFVHVPPGPGHYPVLGMGSFGKNRRCRSSSDVLGTTFHAVHAPHQMKALLSSDGSQLCGFKSSEVRSKDRKMEGLGPGSYKNDEAMGQCFASTLKEKKKVGKKGAFGSTADRFFRSAMSPASVGVPSPGTYSLPAKTGVPSVSGFRATGERSSMVLDTGAPGPGTYEAFDAVDYKSKYKKPRAEHLSFGAGHDRHSFADGMVKNTAPPPGTYDPGRVQHRITGAASSSGQRSLFGEDDSLGPGMYEVSKSLIRDTHNAVHHERSKKLQGKHAPPTAPKGGGAGGGVAGARKRLSMSRGFSDDGFPWSVNMQALAQSEQLPQLTSQQQQQPSQQSTDGPEEKNPADEQPPEDPAAPPAEQPAEDQPADQAAAADDAAPVEIPQVPMDAPGDGEGGRGTDSSAAGGEPEAGGDAALPADGEAPPDT